VTKEKLGGAETHNSISGVAHFLAHDDSECLRMIRELISYLPSNNRDDAPLRPTSDPADRADPALDQLVPSESNIPYDIKDIIQRVVDDGEFFEIHEYWAKNIVIGLARMDGRTVGIVANQPAFSRGLPGHQLFGQRRALRALLRCLQYSILTFEDVPGFLPGTGQEFGGIIRHGAKLFTLMPKRRCPR